MMRKILSNYSHLLVTSNKKYLVYNSRTNAFLELDKDLYMYLLGINESEEKSDMNFNVDIKHILEKYKIIVASDEDTNYYYQQKLASYISFFSTKVLSLTLVPTTTCNFDCPYCFETNKPVKTMSESTISDLISFIYKHKQAEMLNITWYGGEPLLAFSTMKKIMHEIETNTKLKLKNHDIITNGYLFNKKTCDFFKKYPLNSIQITLDGNKDSHDEKRKLKRTGKPTFQRIIENIDLILSELPDCSLSIRVNIDRNNENDFIEVYKFLKERWNNNKRLYIYPGFIRIDDDNGKKLSCESLQNCDKVNFYFNQSKENNINVRFYPNSLKKGCIANYLNAYIIGPSGEIYKCWNDVGEIKKIVGYINQEILLNDSLLGKYMVGCSCFEDEECKKCFFFPICSGGCSWYRMRNQFENGEFNLCTLHKEKNVLNKCLEYRYNSINNKKKYDLNFL